MQRHPLSEIPILEQKLLEMLKISVQLPCPRAVEVQYVGAETGKAAGGNGEK